MASIIAKHKILVYNLLSNIAKAGDIPFNSLMILACQINFPPIIAINIYKAILKAGNTAPSLNEIPTTIL